MSFENLLQRGRMLTKTITCQKSYLNLIFNISQFLALNDFGRDALQQYAWILGSEPVCTFKGDVV